MADDDQGSSENYIDLHRRRFLLGMASSPFAGAALAQGASAASDREITVSQDGAPVATVKPYSNGMSVEQFYSYDGQYRGSRNSSANTPSGLELEEDSVSQLFFHEYDGELSLVMIHDAPGSDSGGNHRVLFDGLPDSGSWAVKDDPSHRPDDYPSDGSYAQWGWGRCCTDGGAYSWPADEEVEFTITPRGHSRRGGPAFDGLNTWTLRSGDGTSYPLDAKSDTQVTISVGDAGRPPTLQKQELIDTIRTEAGEVMLDFRAENLEQNAQELLVKVDQALSNEDETFQYEEALQRMLTAERVTKSGVVTGREPARKTAEALTELVVLLAFIGIGKAAVRGLAVGGGVLASKLDEFASIARQGIRRLSGRYAIARRLQRRLDGIIDEALSRVEDFAGEYYDTFESVGETLVSESGSIANVIGLLTGEAVDALAGVKEFIQEALTVLYYDYYVTSPEERNDDGERTSPPGIDTGIDQSMDDLSAAIDAERLEAEGADDRAEVKHEQIESFRNDRDDFVELMEIIEEGRENISLAVGVIAIFAVVAGAASLLGAATSNPIGLAAAAVAADAASKLAFLAAVLTAIVVAITAAAWLVGYNFLQTQMANHEATVSYIIDYEGQEGI